MFHYLLDRLKIFTDLLKIVIVWKPRTVIFLLEVANIFGVICTLTFGAICTYTIRAVCTFLFRLLTFAAYINTYRFIEDCYCVETWNCYIPAGVRKYLWCHLHINFWCYLHIYHSCCLHVFISFINFWIGFIMKMDVNKSNGT